MEVAQLDPLFCIAESTFGCVVDDAEYAATELGAVRLPEPARVGIGDEGRELLREQHQWRRGEHEDDRQQQHENTGVERPGADVIQPVHLDSDEDMYDEEQEEADLDDDEMFKQGFNEKLAQILRLSQENRKKSHLQGTCQKRSQTF